MTTEPNPRQIAADFLRLPENVLPAGDELTRCLVAEGIRLALANAPKDDRGWPRLHVVALRSWVVKKLRSLIPALASHQDENDLFTEVLSSPYKDSLVFQGDVIELAQGYYSPAPTRRVPVDDNMSVLVSGLPTRYFVNAGINVTVSAISRRILGPAASIPEDILILVQSRASYLGTLSDFDEETLQGFVNSESRVDWAPERDWRCYQGNRGRYDFDDWGSENHEVDCPLGSSSLWQAVDTFGHAEYWLRVTSHGQDQMVHVPSGLFRQACLIMDMWEQKPRSILLRKAEGGSVLEVPFFPPNPQRRWLYALGAKWSGRDRERIRWWLPQASVRSTAAVFEQLPVKLEERE